MLPDPDKPLDPHHIGRSAARNCRKSGSPRSKDTAACRIGQTDPSQTPSAARTTGSVREPHPILRGWKDGHCLPYELWCTLRPPFCHRSAAKPEPLRTPAPGTPSAPARHSPGVTDDHNRSGTPVPRSRFESGQFPTGQKKRGGLSAACGVWITTLRCFHAPESSLYRRPPVSPRFLDYSILTVRDNYNPCR